MLRKIALTALVAASASFAAADFIPFTNDTTGSQPNGFMSVHSNNVSFSDTSGADLLLNDYGVQSIGNALGVFGDDPSMLEMNFSLQVASLTLLFGNDDPGFSQPGDIAVLRTYNGANLQGTFFVPMNRDDIMNQSLSASGNFNRATFSYESPNFVPINLIEVVDNVEFAPVPEPATMAALGIGAAALVRRKRKA